MPSAFITGINGFLGQTLARVLLADGWQVGGLMRANAHRGALGNMSGLRISYGDLLDSSAYADSLASYDVFFHVAAMYTHDPISIPHMRDVNGPGAALALRTALAAGVPRLVHSSTIGVILQPQDGTLATEAAVGAPPGASAYVQSKWAGDQAAAALAVEGASVVIVHPVAMLGPGDWRSNSGALVKAALRGDVSRYLADGINWCPVEDVARGMVLAAQRGQPGRRYILGHRHGNLDAVAFLDLIANAAGYGRWRRWWKQRRARKPVAGSRPTRLTCDPSRAIAELGMPQNDLLAAARAEIAWYRQKNMINL